MSRASVNFPEELNDSTDEGVNDENVNFLLKKTLTPSGLNGSFKDGELLLTFNAKQILEDAAEAAVKLQEAEKKLNISTENSMKTSIAKPQRKQFFSPSVNSGAYSYSSPTSDPHATKTIPVHKESSRLEIGATVSEPSLHLLQETSGGDHWHDFSDESDLFVLRAARSISDPGVPRGEVTGITDEHLLNWLGEFLCFVKNKCEIPVI